MRFEWRCYWQGHFGLKSMFRALKFTWAINNSQPILKSRLLYLFQLLNQHLLLKLQIPLIIDSFNDVIILWMLTRRFLIANTAHIIIVVNTIVIVIFLIYSLTILAYTLLFKGLSLFLLILQVSSYCLSV